MWVSYKDSGEGVGRTGLGVKAGVCQCLGSYLSLRCSVYLFMFV